jgi:hypothetical protein
VKKADKPDPARAWMYAEKLLADEEIERIGKMSDHDLVDEMRAEGKDPARVPSAEDLMAGALARARRKTDTNPVSSDRRAVNGGGEAKIKVLPARPGPKRPNIIVWLAAAAVGAFAVGVVVLNQPPVNVAHGLDADGGSTTPDARATKLRDEGLAACVRQSWDTCEKKLDDAKALDPDGENESRVLEARKALAHARHP